MRVCGRVFLAEGGRMDTREITFDKQAVRNVARLYLEWLRKKKKDNE